VASRGLYATGVSTDLNGEFCLGIPRKTIDLRTFLVTYLNSGGQVGDVLKAIVKCDKCELSSLVLTEEPASILFVGFFKPSRRSQNHNWFCISWPLRDPSSLLTT